MAVWLFEANKFDRLQDLENQNKECFHQTMLKKPLLPSTATTHIKTRCFHDGAMANAPNYIPLDVLYSTHTYTHIHAIICLFFLLLLFVPINRYRLRRMEEIKWKGGVATVFPCPLRRIALQPMPLPYSTITDTPMDERTNGQSNK